MVHPYSLFDDYAQLAELSKSLSIIPTRSASPGLGNLVFAPSHFAIVALEP
jgi:hypothetical protein